MKKSVVYALPALLLSLAGCSPIGDKSGSICLIYRAAAIISFLLLLSYCGITRKRELWFLVLFSSITVVNLGYFCLSVSKSLSEALLANRIAYLGSVLLPLSMLMIILQVTRFRSPKWLPSALLALALGMLFIAATPGYLTIYYQEVSLQIVDGVSSLDKVYGPLHFLYLIYLVGYFCSMTAIIFFAAAKKKIDSTGNGAILLIAVFVNIGVWLAEQLVEIDFEILSISYIITELFLLGLNMMVMEKEVEETPPSPHPTAEPAPVEMPEAKSPPSPERLRTLTPTERIILNAYLAGQTTKEIMADLNIKENTLKFHNKNLYSKMGVSSRKQLLEQYCEYPRETE